VIATSEAYRMRACQAGYPVGAEERADGGCGRSVV